MHTVGASHKFAGEQTAKASHTVAAVRTAKVVVRTVMAVVHIAMVADHIAAAAIHTAVVAARTAVANHTEADPVDSEPTVVAEAFRNFVKVRITAILGAAESSFEAVSKVVPMQLAAEDNFEQDLAVLLASDFVQVAAPVHSR